MTYNLASHKSLLAMSATVCAFAFAPAAQAKANFITFHPPNDSAVYSVVGISDHGVIAGSYDDNVGYAHGFLRAADGTYTIFDPTNSVETLVHGMNNKGATVGFYYNPNVADFGFVRSPNGKIVDIVYPGAKTSTTVAVAINDVDVIVGTYIDGATGYIIGFVRYGSQNLQSIQVSGTAGNTYPSGINAGGVITGSYANSNDNVSHGFVRDAGGVVTTFDYPGSDATYAMGINVGGEITGYYASGGNEHGFLRSADGATFTSIDVPEGVGGTVATCINSEGDVAGFYEILGGGDAGGFVRRASGTIKTFGPSKDKGIVPGGINSHGAIAGTTYPGGAERGFLRSR